jgi:hypothetical protein
MKKKKLRPWVKIVLTLVIGVAITSQIFKIFDVLASSGENINGIYHAVISINHEGKSYLKPIDGAWDMNIIVNTKDNYYPCQIVTVIIKDGTVVHDYITKGKELKYLMENYGGLIYEYRQGIMNSIYE